MEKITDKIAALPPDGEYFSLEFFPPKTAMGFSNLRDRLNRMEQGLRPLFVNVTWGAGGSTADKSLELAELCQRELGMTTCLHLTCTNMSRKLIDKALDDAKALGIRNILALRGDPPRKDEYRTDDDDESDAEAGEDFVWAIDLVKYIRRKHGDYFCVGVAAYPEGHADESHPLGQSLEHDLPYLVDKVQAGADFIMTQLFFDIDAYEKFEATLRQHPSGAFKTIPIMPGLMPIQSYAMIKRTAKLSHAAMPPAILDRLNAVKGDDERVKAVGVDILAELVEQVRTVKAKTPGPKGFHFYTLNLEKAVTFILERTNLIPDSPALEEAVVDGPLPASAAPPSLQVNGHAIPPPRSHSRSSRRHSSVGSDPHNRVIVDNGGRRAPNPAWEATGAEAAVPAEALNARANTLAISEGEGALGREATWDDFPNGRFGDARSPAYGEIDGYGVSLHVSVAQAVRLWGRPATTADLDDMFVRHVRGQLAALPWSVEEELLPESSAITPHLAALNARGWWTVASQPAVDGARSADETFGWGPADGFVFQKAFVEFFLPAADWAALRDRLRRDGTHEVVCFYASNAKGDFVCSDGATGGSSSTNAVTWGVFPGKEIVTPTIIEEVSFRAWCEEAFSIWDEWSRVYPRGSPSAALLGGVRDDYWLVNVIHHDFVDQQALWDLLLA
ncbi:methylenetetrahydrofolate reductase 2 [Cordyceps fumosorosea ARSEF 2679]|uniref:Methylenetetrahydrofolate reductase 2 n=1 Tax=Cordyceps fumosorosea (strain ARSEF 2679) TaxID=1081104 RepID=A0A167YBY6_CORFA|nr:methylenetetrahydrofolate reductase 2 [Cordyceps fumosorosea ARSEF 2679]OAA66137.1 methylenetetrahydrofolate reductase 2 [Cordyceps fumosorosea ARSEF 2679]